MGTVEQAGRLGGLWFSRGTQPAELFALAETPMSAKRNSDPMIELKQEQVLHL